MGDGGWGRCERIELRRHLEAPVRGDCASHSTAGHFDSWPWSGDVSVASVWVVDYGVKKGIAGLGVLWHVRMLSADLGSHHATGD